MRGNAARAGMRLHSGIGRHYVPADIGREAVRRRREA